jgi:hypothetical protein
MMPQFGASKKMSLLRLARIALWLGIAGFGGGFVNPSKRRVALIE